MTRVQWSARRGPIEVHWQLGAMPPAAGRWTLLRWSVTPEPVDGGLSGAAAGLLARSLTTLGRVGFACSNADAAAHDGDEVQRLGTAGWSQRLAAHWAGEPASLALVWTRRPDTAFRLFTDAALPWTLQSQVVMLAAADAPAPLVARAELLSLLDEHWAITAVALRAAGVQAVLRPAVDGDAIGVLCLDTDADERLFQMLGADMAAP